MKDEVNIKVGIIGLGKMGLNLAMNAVDRGYEIIGYDALEEVRNCAKKEIASVADSLDSMIDQLSNRKVIWVMVPAGKITTDVLCDLAKRLHEGDIVIDGGNTNYKKTIEHAKMFQDVGIQFLDCGTSGGMSGARFGACLMIGGNREAFLDLQDFFKDLACEDGLLYTGNAGSGHYLKMVHNGVEYGMMQAIGEGFEILEACDFSYDMREVANVWNHGSVVRSWLMELAYDTFCDDPKLDNIKGEVDASGEGEWTVEASLEFKVPAPIIALSLMMRYRSKQDDTYSGKVVAALRNGFGGHEITKR